jgi:hypothetical protein
MELMTKGTKVKIKNAGSGFERFNGQIAAANETIGVSGETQLFDIMPGVGLFLSHDQVERV